MPDTHTSELLSLRNRIKGLESLLNTEEASVHEVKDQVEKVRSEVEEYFEHLRHIIRHEWVVMKQTWDQVEEEAREEKDPEQLKQLVDEAIEQTKEFLPKQ